MVGLVRGKNFSEHESDTIRKYRTNEGDLIMCTRFVHNGNDTIVGFNFDIDLAVWIYTVIRSYAFG